MSFDVLRDKAKMALVTQWLKDDAEQARREDAVTRYIRRFTANTDSQPKLEHHAPICPAE